MVSANKDLLVVETHVYFNVSAGSNDILWWWGEQGLGRRGCFGIELGDCSMAVMEAIDVWEASLDIVCLSLEGEKRMIALRRRDGDKGDHRDDCEDENEDEDEDGDAIGVIRRGYLC